MEKQRKHEKCWKDDFDQRKALEALILWLKHTIEKNIYAFPGTIWTFLEQNIKNW